MMVDATRETRRREEARRLNDIKTQSDVLSEVQPTGDPPGQYRLLLNGHGWEPDPDQPGEPRRRDEHQVELRLPYDYPNSPPEVRWLTPLFHPNVSSSGFVSLKEIGLSWQPEMTLEVLCERLWDLVRGVYLQLDGASHSAAAQWFREHDEQSAPWDSRPLVSWERGGPGNVIRYRRRQLGSNVGGASSESSGGMSFGSHSTGVGTSIGSADRSVLQGRVSSRVSSGVAVSSAGGRGERDVVTDAELIEDGSESGIEFLGGTQGKSLGGVDSASRASGDVSGGAPVDDEGIRFLDEDSKG